MLTAVSGINYHPSQDQRAIVAAFDRPLAEIMPISRLHDPDDSALKQWSALTELGLFGISAREEAGGAGLGATEEVLLVERLGRHLASPTVFATMAATHIAGVDDLVSQFLAGTARVAPACRSSDGIVTFDGAGAGYTLLRNRDGGALFKRGTGGGEHIDDYLWAVKIEQEELGAKVAECDTQAILRARLIDAAALAGLANAALDMAVDYAGIREQFGRPIGAFQAVKHHCANMMLAARAASDQASFAAIAIDGGRADAVSQVESALLIAMDAATLNAGANIQIHGGIGFSDEASPHLLLKRAHVLVTVAGGRDEAVARVAEADPAL